MKISHTLLYLFIGMTIVGCGHNGVVYRNGDYWNIGVDPNAQTAGIQRFNGETLMIGSKENTTVNVTMTSNDGGDATITKGSAGIQQQRVSAIKYSTGTQVNGYMVDLAEKNPELAAMILAESNKDKFYLIKDNKIVEVTKEEYEQSLVSKESKDK